MMRGGKGWRATAEEGREAAGGAEAREKWQQRVTGTEKVQPWWV